jgi:hypothetical protein
MPIVIKTNNQWRDFSYANEVPKDVLEDQFDHLDKDTTDHFLKYKGTWYHLSDFLRIDRNNEGPFNGWEGSHNHSESSGVVIRISTDCECYQIGSWYQTSD